MTFSQNRSFYVFDFRFYFILQKFALGRDVPNAQTQNVRDDVPRLMAVLCEAFVHLYVVFDKSVVNEHADGTHKEYFEFGAAGEKFRVVEQKVHHRKFRLGTAFAGGHPVDDLIFVAVAHNVVGVEIEVDYVVGFGQGGNIVFKFFGFFCRKKSKKPVVKGFERDASDVAEFVGVRGMNTSVKRGDDFPALNKIAGFSSACSSKIRRKAS